MPSPNYPSEVSQPMIRMHEKSKFLGVVCDPYVNLRRWSKATWPSFSLSAAKCVDLHCIRTRARTIWSRKCHAQTQVFNSLCGVLLFDSGTHSSLIKASINHKVIIKSDGTWTTSLLLWSMSHSCLRSRKDVLVQRVSVVLFPRRIDRLWHRLLWSIKCHQRELLHGTATSYDEHECPLFSNHHLAPDLCSWTRR